MTCPDPTPEGGQTALVETTTTATTSPSRPTPRPWWVLTHPVFVLCLVLLVGNDLIGKARWPGLVTGKLSDVVGPVVLGVLVALVTGRRAAGLAVPVSVMVLVKTTTAGADLAVWVLETLTPWSHRIVADPTDLVGLVALPLVPWLLDRQRPARDDSRRRDVMRWLVLVAGGFACAATSVDGPYVRDRVAVTESDRLITYGADQSAPTFTARTASTPAGPWVEGLPEVTDTIVATSSSASVCLERTPGVCVRTGPGLEIAERVDGGDWVTVWALDATESWVGQNVDDAVLVGADDVTAGEILELRDGTVVVAMGVFDPVSRAPDGVWSPEPVELREVAGTTWLFVPFAVAGLALSLTPAFTPAPRRRSRNLGWVAGVFSLPAVGAVGIAWILSPYDDFVLFPVFLGVLVASPIALLIALIAWAYLANDTGGSGLIAWAFLGALAITAAVSVATLGLLEVWRAGALGWTPTRLGVGALAVIGAAVLSAALASFVGARLTTRETS